MIAYDIGNNRARSAVCAVLKGYGSRVQYSVFECWLTARELNRLDRALAGIELQEGDCIQAYRCADGRLVDGRPPGPSCWWVC